MIVGKPTLVGQPVQADTVTLIRESDWKACCTLCTFPL